MRRGVAILCLAGLATVAVSPVADGRRHRLRVPPAELAHALTVDEFEFGMRPSRTVVGAGVVSLRTYNRGEDDHNIVVVERGGVRREVYLKPGTVDTVSATLSPGTYTIVCSLFAGTPDSHEDRGMKFTLRVR